MPLGCADSVSINVAGFIGGLIEGEHVYPSMTSVFFSLLGGGKWQCLVCYG